MRIFRRPCIAPACALAIFAATSCLCGCTRPGAQEIVTAEESNLKPLSIAYGRFQAANQNHPPASEAEFKKYLQDSEESLLQQFNTDSDKVFVSERDGQPYVVFYRGKLPPSGVIAHEREGVGGRRIVAYPFGSVVLVDGIRFRELVPSE